MNITSGEIATALTGIREAILYSFLHKVEAVYGETWVFLFRKGKEKQRLLISLTPLNSRVHLLSSPVEKTSTLEGFGKLLKKTLTRSYLTAVEQVNNDRALKLTLETDSGVRYLVAEIMGTRSNAYLLDADGKVLALALNRKTANTPGNLYAPPKLRESGDVATHEENPDFNLELEKRYGITATEEILQRAKSSIVSTYRGELKKLKKRLKSLQAKRDELARQKDDKRLAEILQAGYQKIEKGTKLVTLDDYFRPGGGKIDIKLDPKLNPSENVALYYKRFRRYEKGLPRIEEERLRLESRSAELSTLVKRVESAKNIEDLSKWLEEKKTDAPKKSTAEKKRASQESSLGRKFISSEGYTIFVGRNDRENDELTRVANGRDLWLHARDYPGSHVLVRLPKKIELPRKTLMEAGMLALKYSKAVKAGKGEVTYAYAKNVRKPKGFAPGKVLVSQDKFLLARIDQKVVDAMKERS